MATYTTYEGASAGYLANSDYDDGAGSVEKARLFRAACRALQMLRPTSAAAGGASHTFDAAAIRTELQRVQGWLAANDSDAANGDAEIQYVDLRDAR